MNKNLRAVYEEEYSLMKKQIKAQEILIGLLIILALIVCFMSMDLAIDYEALKRENEALEGITQMQNSMISDLETNCNDLYIEIEELKEEYVY